MKGFMLYNYSAVDVFSSGWVWVQKKNKEGGKLCIFYDAQISRI